MHTYFYHLQSNSHRCETHDTTVVLFTVLMAVYSKDLQLNWMVTAAAFCCLPKCGKSHLQPLPTLDSGTTEHSESISSTASTNLRY